MSKSCNVLERAINRLIRKADADCKLNVGLCN